MTVQNLFSMDTNLMFIDGTAVFVILLFTRTSLMFFEKESSEKWFSHTFAFGEIYKSGSFKLQFVNHKLRFDSSFGTLRRDLFVEVSF